MPLIKVIRHGFEFWEAPRCANPPLPELEQPVSRTSRLLTNTDYRRRSTPRQDSTIATPAFVPEAITHIQNAVIDAFGIDEKDFHGRCRKDEVARARIASMALCRAYTNHTVEEIGEAHQRHHRLVCHATYRFIELQTNPTFLITVTRIECGLMQKAA
jgi:hypothetical protein